MKKDKYYKVNIEPENKSELSRRRFLLGAGSLIVGGALGGGLLSGCKEKIVTTTKVVSSTKTVSVPTTVEVPVTTTVTETSGVTETATVTETTTVTETIAEAKTVTVTDSRGREVTLNLPINRVCYLHGTVAEGLKIINAWDKVVSVDNHTDDTVLIPEIPDMPVITYSDTGAIDYEAIISLEPDILFILATPGHFDVDAIIETLEPEIPVVCVFDTYDTETWTTGIELLGTIMQKEEEAQEFLTFASEIENRMTAITSTISEEEKPRYFMKLPGWSVDDFCTFTDEFGFVAKLSEVTGAVNIAADIPSTGGWVQEVDREWLMTEDYSFIIAHIWDALNPGVVGYGVTDTTATQECLNEVAQLDVFSASQAVADGNVYLADSLILCTPRYLVLMEYMAKMFHPDLFADLDPKATHQEYLTRFMRVDHNLEESGMFYYPEP